MHAVLYLYFCVLLFRCLSLQYVGALAGLLCVNFIVGLVLTIYKKQVGTSCHSVCSV